MVGKYFKAARNLAYKAAYVATGGKPWNVIDKAEDIARIVQMVTPLLDNGGRGGGSTNPPRPPRNPTTMDTPKSGRTLKLRGRRTLSTASFAGKRFRYRRPSRMQKRRYRKAFNGVQYCIERVANVTDDRCVYLEHSTAPMNTLAKYVIYALLKKLLNAAGIQFTAWEEIRAGRVQTGDTFALSYRKNMVDAPVSIGYTVVAGDVTYGAIADGFWLVVYNNLINCGALVGMQSNALLQLASYVGVDGRHHAELNMRTCTISILTKSTLKMQNRSVNVITDDQSDDVNNVPLYGKSYQGRGNGLVPRDTSSRVVPCDSVYGWTMFGAGPENQLAEPPQAYHFQYCKKSAKVHIGPGRIKTSVLTDKLNMSMDRFLRHVYALYTSSVADTNQYSTAGKIRLFALERPIAKQDGEAIGINVSAEHDFKAWIDVNVSRGRYTSSTNIVL